MISNKLLITILSACGLAVASLSAADGGIGVVNFATCLTETEFGKKEQEKMDNLRQQFTTLVQDTEKELREISAKFEDTEFLDSLSPKAEEDLKTRFQALNEDLNRYQSQFYQLMQHANMQMMHTMSSQIARASEKIAKQKKLDYIVNREACFYYRPDLDITTQIASEMDTNFKLDADAKKLSENSEMQETDALEDASNAG